MTDAERLRSLEERVHALEAAATLRTADDGYVSRAEFCRKEGVKPDAIRARERRDPSFPRPVRLSRTRTAYRRTELERWCAARTAREAARETKFPATP